MRQAAAAGFLLAGSYAAHADELVRRGGRCQSLTILDRRDAVRCADEMLVQAGAGQRDFVFRAGETVVLFVTIDQKVDVAGLRELPMSRIEFGVGSQVETIPLLSVSCRSVDPAATWRAGTSCKADTLNGRLAAQFATIDGDATPIAPPALPDTIR